MTPPHSLPIAWIDASSGATGELLLGALVGAGVPVGVLVDAIDKVAPGRVGLEVEEVRQGDDDATRCHVEIAEPTTHESWRDVERVLAGAGLHEDVRSLAHDVFSRLAEAEGRLHGQPAAEVRLDEHGGLDTIAEVVGVCAAVAHLRLDRVVVSELSVGGDTISSGHDRLPVPPPVVVELMGGVPGSGGSGDPGRCTPAGAALLTTLADDWGPQPAMSVTGTGVGVGGDAAREDRDLVRIVVGVSTGSTPGDGSTTGGGSTSERHHT